MRGVNFLITNDLNVMMASVEHIFSLLLDLGIGDANALDERSIDLGKDR